MPGFEGVPLPSSAVPVPAIVVIVAALTTVRRKAGELTAKAEAAYPGALT